MSHTIKILPAEELIIVIFEGEVVFDEIIQAGLELKSHPNFSENFCGVNDFRNCKKNFTQHDLEKLKERVSYKKGNSVRWCSINSTPKETGLSLLLKNHLETIHQMEVFTTVNAASEYLNRDLSKYLS